MKSYLDIECCSAFHESVEAVIRKDVEAKFVHPIPHLLDNTHLLEDSAREFTQGDISYFDEGI